MAIALEFSMELHLAMGYTRGKWLS
jgi:hypothetical protein